MPRSSYPADRVMYALRLDSGMAMEWTAQEMQRRSLLAAWRLRAAGLRPGDRLMTWSPSTPTLPAVYWGAMRAGIVLVPVDLRMTTAVIERIAGLTEVGVIAVDEGYDAPDPVTAGLTGLQVLQLNELTADPDPDWPADWEAQIADWDAPDRDSLFEIHFTSGTTAEPKGVLLTHGNVLETMGMFSKLLRPRHLRAVSILPLSHLLEQVSTLLFGTMMGAEIVYVRSRNPRVIVEAMSELGANVIVGTPQLLELLWAAITRRIEQRGLGSVVSSARTHRPPPALPPAATPVPPAPRAFRRSPAADGLVGLLPATRAAAGVGGHRHRGPAGLRLDRGRLRRGQR